MDDNEVYRYPIDGGHWEKVRDGWRRVGVTPSRKIDGLGAWTVFWGIIVISALGYIIISIGGM